MEHVKKTLLLTLFTEVSVKGGGGGGLYPLDNATIF